jgi:hypothetical protein
MRVIPLLCAFLLFRGPAGAADAVDFRKTVEADWLLQEHYRAAAPSRPVATSDDAAGACDGVKDGTYGFHTGSAENPWWQVDLGAATTLARVVVWNRCDGAAERAARLEILLSADGRRWERAYAHDGTTFGGVPDKKPLEVDLGGATARFVRLQVPGISYLHLDEVEVFGADGANLARGKPADQVSVSQWSRAHFGDAPCDFAARTAEILQRCAGLIDELAAAGRDVRTRAERRTRLLAALERGDAKEIDLYMDARWLQRELLLDHPVLDFETLLFATRVPGSFNHMSDQYIGWWSRPGGGVKLLRNWKANAPVAECISAAFTEPGSFLQPVLSYEGDRVLFAWCRHYPNLAGEQNKLDKGNVPEDAFYHVFEMRVDGGSLRQLTRGKYDDFDAHYLPGGRIVFLSTRRGQFVQCGRESARRSTLVKDLPDVYVRCGGGPERPCVVYTLHTMDADGGDVVAISPFEMFEWTPTVAHDGSLLYSRWDYIDRDNMPYMGLWAINPDGTNARAVYKNFTRTPHCVFEPRCIPGSDKIIFTASAHHDQTKGSLVVLDPNVGAEGPLPIARLTPEVAFPEIEAWPLSYYANPFPLSERFHLVTWGCEGLLAPSQSGGWDRWHSVLRPRNGMGLYLFDAQGAMELLYRDPEISAMYPTPLRPCARPPVVASHVAATGPEEGCFLVADVYRGLKTVARGQIAALRIIAVPPKTHPTMNFPVMGVTHDDPGKCVLGTVPVEEDGSAYFRVPAGMIVFFQALDAGGKAVQTMRSATHVQPGQTLGCAGCHEGRNTAAPPQTALASRRAPSKIAVGPEGSWPFRYDRLVQPVLERRCVSCHAPGGADPAAARVDLTAAKSYDCLVAYGRPSLQEHVLARYRQGFSIEGAGAAAESPLLALLAGAKPHHGVALDARDLERLVTWLDAYGQRLGSFSAEQEAQLLTLRRECARLLIERGPETATR